MDGRMKDIKVPPEFPSDTILKCKKLAIHIPNGFHTFRTYPLCTQAFCTLGVSNTDPNTNPYS